MQNKIFWVGLIGSVLVLIGSCKKEESDSTATTASCTVSTTPAGSIALGSNNISGIYSSSWQEVVPSSGCNDNSSALASWSYQPGGRNSFKYQIIITSNTSYTIADQWYSDSSCSTSIGYIYYGYENVEVGDIVSGLTQVYSKVPSSGYKVDQTYSCVTAKGETDNATTLLNNWFEGSATFTNGEEQSVAPTAKVYKSYWATDNGSGTSWFWMSEKSTSTYNDWSTDDNWYYPTN